MTYQNASAPSAFYGISSALRAALGAVGGAFKSMGDSYMKAAVASSRMHLIETLQGKSDAELEQLGLKRGEITRYVLRDLYYV